MKLNTEIWSMIMLLVFFIGRITVQITSGTDLNFNVPGTNKSASVGLTSEVPDPETSAAITFNNTLYTDHQNCKSGTITVSSDTFVPIFIFNRDRLNSLRQCIESYFNTISSPYEIIIIDHNSTYPPMIEYLQELEQNYSIKVHRIPPMRWINALNAIANIAQEYLESRPDAQYYVVTDPDIALLRTAPDILLYFAGVLEACPQINCIGPSLQISDIPKHYTQKKKGEGTLGPYESEASKFWKTVPSTVTWNGLGYQIADEPIDTTFAMRRRSLRFKRLTQPSVRCHAPYSAVHVDWYEDSNNLTEDKIWYNNRAEKDINHWRN